MSQIHFDAELESGYVLKEVASLFRTSSKLERKLHKAFKSSKRSNYSTPAGFPIDHKTFLHLKPID
jgi:hypothetical protein